MVYIYNGIIKCYKPNYLIIMLHLLNDTVCYNALFPCL